MMNDDMLDVQYVYTYQRACEYMIMYIYMKQRVGLSCDLVIRGRYLIVRY